MNEKVKLVNICPVFLTDDVVKTTEYYVNVLGFKYAKHFDKKDNFSHQCLVGAFLLGFPLAPLKLISRSL
jgi:catechol 2,3-dioxygenase-like lactoylglutathione lyase family enzyme